MGALITKEKVISLPKPRLVSDEGAGVSREAPYISKSQVRRKGLSLFSIFIRNEKFRGAKPRTKRKLNSYLADGGWDLNSIWLVVEAV